MDRAIRFRAWDNRNKKMISWNELLNSKELLQSFFGNEHYQTNPPKYFYERMQFTGLLDCDGKEIYLGDIVQATFQMRKQEPVEFISPVDFSIQWGATVEGDDVYSLGRCRNIKVLGNLYEHPNLLNNES